MLSPVMMTMLRHLSHETFSSGEDIAQRLGCSRASVHTAVQAAIEAGLPVHAVRGRGYRLAKPLSWLDREGLSAHFLNAGVDLQFFDTLESTNSFLLSVAQSGASHRTLVVAESQTGGRGRRGRRWLSGLGGGLTFSYLWRSQKTVAELSGLSLAVGVLLVRALRELGLAEACVKWPNDIVINQRGTRKLAGVLIELSGELSSPCAAVIGVGLNVCGADDLRAQSELQQLQQPPQQPPQQPIADMCEFLGPLDRNAVLVSLVRSLDSGLEQFEQAGFDAFKTEWESCHAFQGQEVDVLNGMGEHIRGVALGVDATGALRLGTASGERCFHSGEVSLRGVMS